MASALSESDLKEVLNSIEKFRALDINVEKLDVQLASGSKVTVYRDDEDRNWYLK